MGKFVAFFWRDMLEASSYRFAFLTQIVSVSVLLVPFHFFSNFLGDAPLASLDPYGGDYFSFAVIGVALANYATIALQSTRQAIRRAQMNGTLEALLTTRANTPTIAIASSLYGFVMGTVHMAIFLTIASLVFGANFHAGNLPAAVLVLALTVASTMAVGILAAAFVVVMKQGDPITMAFTSVSYLVSGVIYPTTVLPHGLQIFADVMPLTHGLRALRLAVLGDGSMAAATGSFIALAVLGGLLLPASLWAFHHAVLRAKRQGSLGQY